ncbi:related to Regulator of rDNA transcription 14 [Zygosaccharomyces bailii]|nr:related to Regulator of rDNA transcription 14 [Zygosaccharomyces bailii]
MPSDVSELHANNAVNRLLVRMLPGVSHDNGGKMEKNKKGSKAQLIDRNLKRRVQLQELDVTKLKKKQSKIKRREVRNQKRNLEHLEQLARLKVFEKHKKRGNLTEEELTHLNEIVELNHQKAKSWEMDEENKEDLFHLQKYILKGTVGDSGRSRSNKRRERTKNFNERKGASASVTRRYPGLTPGLAPVDMSDEEESSEEEREEL